MSTNVGIILIVALLVSGALLAAWAGIRSIQSARKVSFFRMRRAHMLAGWKWLLLALFLFSFSVASALVGEPVVNQLFPPTPGPTASPTQTPLPTATLLPSATQTDTPNATATLEFTSTPTPTQTSSATSTPSQTPTRIATITSTSTLTPSQTATRTATASPAPTRTVSQTPSQTPTPTPNRNATSTAAARTVQAEQAIAMLSQTPTPTRIVTATMSRTPTFTPSSTSTAIPSQTAMPTLTRTPVPTATLEPTRTQRPTLTLTFTPTQTATPTASFTPASTFTSSPLPTFIPTATPRPTLTSSPTRTPLPTFTFTAIPSSTPTPAPSATSTATDSPPPTATMSQTPTSTLTPSRTPTRTPTPTPNRGCDRIEFVSDVTVPRNSIFAPGASFTKVWRLKNVGTCTWKTTYRVVLVSGDRMSGQNLMPLPVEVAPDQTIDLSMKFTAPTVEGTYQGNWQIRNDKGEIFGTTATANRPFSLFIRVKASSLTGTVYDFVASACSAQWSSGAGTLNCQGANLRSKGYVLRQSLAQTENGVIVVKPSLLTVPQNTLHGYVRALYPSFKVQKGDRFQATVSCEVGATSCGVLFRLDYQLADGVVHELWSVEERYNRNFSTVDIDLSSLAGRDVNFILTVLSLGPASDNRALWVEPRIVRGGTAPSVTLTPTP